MCPLSCEVGESPSFGNSRQPYGGGAAKGWDLPTLKLLDDSDSRQAPHPTYVRHP